MSAELRWLCSECDRLNAEIKRLRARIEVTRDDVKQAGVTRIHAQAWADAKGYDAVVLSWTHSIADVINTHADADAERCALDILDEMAAMVIS